MPGSSKEGPSSLPSGILAGHLGVSRPSPATSGHEVNRSTGSCLWLWSKQGWEAVGEEKLDRATEGLALFQLARMWCGAAGDSQGASSLWASNSRRVPIQLPPRQPGTITDGTRWDGVWRREFFTSSQDHGISDVHQGERQGARAGKEPRADARAMSSAPARVEL